MSTIVFPYVTDFTTTATPSSGFAIGFDLDGIFKQKDEYGVISPLNKGLSDVLKSSSDTGTFSLILGTNSYLLSKNGGGSLSLDYGNPSTIFLSTDYGVGSESYLQIGTNSIILNSNLGSVSISSPTNINLVSSETNLLTSNKFLSVSGLTAAKASEILSTTNHVRIGLYDTYFSFTNDGESITIWDTSTQSQMTTVMDKWPVIIASRNSGIDPSVLNSVIIGGSNMTASSSDTVYLGTNVNINNAYTLPSTDGTPGYILKTDGAGNVSWNIDSGNQNLEHVLSIGDNSGVYNIILGTSAYLGSSASSNTLSLNSAGSTILSTDSGLLNTSYLQLDTENVIISTSTFSLTASGTSITTLDLEGLKYSTDYTATFVTQSLVTKGYVDGIVKPLDSYNTAFVDSNYGSDVIGQINSFDKPFQTISAAISSLLLSTSSGTVYIRRGVYTETVNLQNGFTYYCESGVVFTAGGFSDIAGAATAKVLGWARFEGTSGTLLPLRLINGSNVEFEFDKCDNTFYFATILNSTANIRGNYIYTRSDNAYGIAVRGTSNVTIKVGQKIESTYRTISVSNSFSGTLTIDCPQINCNTDSGIAGYIPNTSMALFVDSDTTGNIIINGKLSNNSGNFVYTLLNPDFTTRFDSSTAIFGGLVTINGEIKGNYTKGLYVGGTVSSSQLRVKGNINSNRESVILNSNLVKTFLSDGMIMTTGTGSFPYAISVIGTSSTMYIKNSVIYNTQNNSSMIYMNSTQSTVGIYDTLGYSSGTTGQFIYTTQSVNIGFHSVRSNKDNTILVTDTFSPSGFIWDSGLFIPNF